MVALLTDIPTYTKPSPAPLRLVTPRPARLRPANRPMRPTPSTAPTHAIRRTHPIGTCRPTRPSPQTFRRRRVAALGLLVLSACLVIIAVQAALGRAGGGPLTTTGVAGGLRTAAAESWVVRPGDTLWSIASAIAPGRDARPIVDRLAGELGGSSLFPGEVVPIPAGLR